MGGPDRMADSVNTEYQVNIPVFEGPMDLLLHLVTKNRIDIHDIPIQSITSQYLDYLNAASEFDLELGSSFFAMASTLLLIKSRVLLPKRLTKSKVLQKYLEGSNVQVADEMVNLIIAQRAYQLNSKAITTSDEMLEQANNLKR